MDTGDGGGGNSGAPGDGSPPGGGGNGVQGAQGNATPGNNLFWKINVNTAQIIMQHYCVGNELKRKH